MPDFNPRAEIDSASVDLIEPEADSTVTTFLSIDSFDCYTNILDKFSALDKICRIIAYSFHFIQKSQQKSVPETSAIDHSRLTPLSCVSLRRCRMRLLHSISLICIATERFRRNYESSHRFLTSMESSEWEAVSSLSYEIKHPAL